MSADVMQKISIQNGPLIMPREERKDKNAFSEILSSTMNLKSGGKNETIVKLAADTKVLESTPEIAVGLKETLETSETSVRLNETKEIPEVAVRIKEMVKTSETAMGVKEMVENPEAVMGVKETGESPEAAVSKKETEEIPEEAVKNEEAVVVMNLFPEIKTESQMPMTTLEGKAVTESVEESKSAVDRPKEEKNPISELLGRNQNEFIPLKDLTNEKDQRIIEIPKDQGIIVSDEHELVKAASDKPELNIEAIKNAVTDEKSMPKESGKLPEEKPVSEKIQAVMPKQDGTAKDELKVVASTGKDSEMKLEPKEETKEVKDFKGIYQAMEVKEPVKEVKTASEDFTNVEEALLPMNETKVAINAAVSEKASPKSIDFEKTFDNATAEIMKSMETIKEGGKTTMKVSLHPEELGKMEITLTMEDGKLSGKILLDNREIRQIFTERLEELSNTLKQNSIQIGKFEVGVGDRGEGNQGRREGQQQMQNPFRGYFSRKTENAVYPVSPEREIKEINLLA